MRLIQLFILIPLAALAQPQTDSLPLLGWAHIGVRVSDVAKSRAFYNGVLNLEMPFDLKTPDGQRPAGQYYKVNDTQYIEIAPNLKPGMDRMTHVSITTTDIAKLHQMLEDRGLKPGPITTGRDGNKACNIVNPPGQRLARLEFTEYEPDSLHSKTNGKDMSAKRLSNHLQFVGIPVTDLDAAVHFYQAMGFKETARGGDVVDLQMPGRLADFVELVNRPSPGPGALIGLAGQDLQFLYKLAADRGSKPVTPLQPGPTGKLQFAILDPDATRVEIREGPAGPGRPARVKSFVTIYNVADGSKKVIFSGEGFYQAPNWSPDGKYLLMNAPGRLTRLYVDSGKMEPVDTGKVKGVNNDHGVSHDGKLLAISAGNVFVLPATGGEPRQVTNQTPSYFHGFSPDDKWMVMCAERNGNFDIYRVATAGGNEERMTTSPGYDDGSEYSPDGKWIYFNSNRSGSWDIWRIPADGAGPNDSKAQQITNDEWEDWFPHISPDGKWMTVITFEKGIPNHPANQNVMLRIMPAPGARPVKPQLREIVKLFGGQGTINVNSWSPDSKQFAYVSYELID